MAAQKFTNFDKFFKTHADRTAVKIQSNKIISNEVKDSEALLEPLYGGKVMDFLADPIDTNKGPKVCEGELLRTGHGCRRPAQMAKAHSTRFVEHLLRARHHSVCRIKQ